MKSRLMKFACLFTFLLLLLHCQMCATQSSAKHNIYPGESHKCNSFGQTDVLAIALDKGSPCRDLERLRYCPQMTDRLPTIASSDLRLLRIPHFDHLVILLCIVCRLSEACVRQRLGKKRWESIDVTSYWTAYWTVIAGWQRGCIAIGSLSLFQQMPWKISELFSYLCNCPRKSRR